MLKIPKKVDKNKRWSGEVIYVNEMEYFGRLRLIFDDEDRTAMFNINTTDSDIFDDLRIGDQVELELFDKDNRFKNQYCKILRVLKKARMLHNRYKSKRKYWYPNSHYANT